MFSLYYSSVISTLTVFLSTSGVWKPGRPMHYETFIDKVVSNNNLQKSYQLYRCWPANELEYGPSLTLHTKEVKN